MRRWAPSYAATVGISLFYKLLYVNTGPLLSSLYLCFPWTSQLSGRLRSPRPSIDAKEASLRALHRVSRGTSTAQESMRWIVSPPWPH